MFKKSDIRGFAVLLPLVAAVLLLWLLAKPSTRRQAMYADNAGKTNAETVNRRDTLFRFDPNTASYEELRMLGLSQTAAASVVSRQKNGYAFDVPERLAAVYGVDDSLYMRLKPYIAIGEKYRARPREERRTAEKRREIKYTAFGIDTVSAATLTGMGFTERQAVTIINYREACGGIRTLEQLARCYAVDSTMLDSLAKYAVFAAVEESDSRNGIQFPIDINTADSAMLRRVQGIGEVTVGRILEYRAKLGGFADIRQLAEIKGVTESNFDKILTQIYCDTCVISKIDINFASPKRLCEHPYIGDRKTRIINSKRLLKGGWSNIEEMTDDKIFTVEEAEKLRPYLRFTQTPEE